MAAVAHCALFCRHCGGGCAQAGVWGCGCSTRRSPAFAPGPTERGASGSSGRRKDGGERLGGGGVYALFPRTGCVPVCRTAAPGGKRRRARISPHIQSNPSPGPVTNGESVLIESVRVAAAADRLNRQRSKPHPCSRAVHPQTGNPFIGCQPPHGGPSPAQPSTVAGVYRLKKTLILSLSIPVDPRRRSSEGEII